MGITTSPEILTIKFHHGLTNKLFKLTEVFVMRYYTGYKLPYSTLDELNAIINQWTSESNPSSFSDCETKEEIEHLKSSYEILNKIYTDFIYVYGYLVKGYWLLHMEYVHKPVPSLVMNFVKNKES